MHLKSGMQATCRTWDLLSLRPPVTERNVYRELECGAGEVRTRTGRWLRLNGQLLR